MLTLTIRPVAAFCNARCSYCYHDDDKLKRMPFMTNDVLLSLVKSYQLENRKQINYVWHGGEPMLAGIKFYQTALEFQKQYQQPYQKIINTIQTNAWAINEEWALFFLKNKFHIGVSLDGNEEITDNQRGIGYFQKCMKGISYLKKYDIPFSCICIVTNKSIKSAKQLFNFFISNDIKNISFNPIFGDYPDYNFENPNEFGDFMKVIYDEWMMRNDQKIQIRFLKEVILAMLGGEISLCAMQGGCQNHLVIENDGTIQPCHVDGKHKVSLGNILNTSLEQAASHTEFSTVQDFINLNCTGCKWYNLCGGDCVRFISAEENTLAKTPFCFARKTIFSHIEQDLIHKGYIEAYKKNSNFKGISITTL